MDNLIGLHPSVWENNTDFYNNFIINIEEKNEPWYKRIEFFFNNKLGRLLWYIRLHLLDLNSEKSIARIIDVTSASWYLHLSGVLKEKYRENWYEDWVFIKWKATEFLSYVLRYIYEKYPQKNIVLVSCLEQNKPYLEPVIDNIKSLVWDILDKVTGWWDIVSFTIYLKK